MVKQYYYIVFNKKGQIFICYNNKNWAASWQNQQSGCAPSEELDQPGHLRLNLSRLVTKPTKWHVRPAKTQISLGISPVWSESSLCAQWLIKDPSFPHADSEETDQTGRMPRLIWVFSGRTYHCVGFVTRRLKFNLLPLTQKMILK